MSQNEFQASSLNPSWHRNSSGSLQKLLGYLTPFSIQYPWPCLWTGMRLMLHYPEPFCPFLLLPSFLFFCSYTFASSFFFLFIINLFFASLLNSVYYQSFPFSLFAFGMQTTTSLLVCTLLLMIRFISIHLHLVALTVKM